MLKNKNSSPEIKTFGCRLNIWESQVISDHASKHGHSDLVIFNTCAVTSEAERQATEASAPKTRVQLRALLRLNSSRGMVTVEKTLLPGSQKLNRIRHMHDII